MMRWAFIVLVLGSCGGKSRATSEEAGQPPAPSPSAADASVVPVSAAVADAAVAPAKSDHEVLADAEQAAYGRARPILEAHCGSCHSARGAKATKKKLRHFSIDGYPFGGHHSATIGRTVREVLGLTGRKPTMPRGREGSVRGADLDAIVAWSEAFDRAKAAGVHGDATEAHPHNHH